MKSRIIAAVCLAVAMTSPAIAEPAGSSQWVGVWQGKLSGVPSVTLTLAQDTGSLSGTLVLNIIERDSGGQPHIVAVDPHALVNPRVAANTLSFGVRKIDGSADLLNFTVALTPEGKANIRCTNCGADAPAVELVKGL